MITKEEEKRGETRVRCFCRHYLRMRRGQQRTAMPSTAARSGFRKLANPLQRSSRYLALRAPSESNAAISFISAPAVMHCNMCQYLVLLI